MYPTSPARERPNWTCGLGPSRSTRRPGRSPSSRTGPDHGAAEEAATVWVLDGVGLTDLVHDVRPPMGFFTGDDLDLTRGLLEDTLDWWVVLRSLLGQRPVHTPGDTTVPDHRTITPDDTDADPPVPPPGWPPARVRAPHRGGVGGGVRRDGRRHPRYTPDGSETLSRIREGAHRAVSQQPGHVARLSRPRHAPGHRRSGWRSSRHRPAGRPRWPTRRA